MIAIRKTSFAGLAVLATLVAGNTAFAADRDDYYEREYDRSVQQQPAHEQAPERDYRTAAPAAGYSESGDSKVQVFSGGVGEDIDYIRSIQHNFDLKVLFTEMSGAYLADLPVVITDKEGTTILSTVTKGPILLVNLPAGNYDLSARDGDIERHQKVSIGKGIKSYQVRFPNHPGEVGHNG